MGQLIVELPKDDIAQYGKRAFIKKCSFDWENNKVDLSFKVVHYKEYTDVPEEKINPVMTGRFEPREENFSASKNVFYRANGENRGVAYEADEEIDEDDVISAWDYFREEYPQIFQVVETVAAGQVQVLNRRKKI